MVGLNFFRQHFQNVYKYGRVYLAGLRLSSNNSPTAPLPYSIQTLAFVGTAFCPCVDRSNDATYRHRKMRIPSFTLLAVLSYVAMIGATPLEARAPPAEVLDPRQLYVVLQRQVERF